MNKKEIISIVKNPVYYIIMFLPFILAFIMSEGTKNYINLNNISNIALKITNIELYKGIILNSRIQFAVSELSFMLMMTSILIGQSLFQERSLHIWDRIVKKESFIAKKFLYNYIFTIVMIVINTIMYNYILDILLSYKSILILSTLPIISLLLGIYISLTVKNKAILSNTILMIVMLSGYFGGALSMTSVLQNTKYMNYLMYLSPITFSNKLIFKDFLKINIVNEIIIWILSLFILSTILIYLIKRRIKNGSII